MNLIQQLGDFLNLIQNNPCPGRPVTDQGLKPMRVAGELEE
jgi:hypothetical protein